MANYCLFHAFPVVVLSVEVSADHPYEMCVRDLLLKIQLGTVLSIFALCPLFQICFRVENNSSAPHFSA